MIERISTDPILYNGPAEEAAIGSVLISPDELPLIRGIVTADDFFIVRHQWIYQAMCRLADQHQAIDLTTVATALGSRLSEVGGPAYLTGLVSQVPNSLNSETYAAQVKEFAIRRRLERAGASVKELSRTDGDVTEIVTRAIREVSEAANHLIGGRSQDAATLAMQHYDQVLKASETPEWPGVKTGFQAIDELLDGGFQPGQMILVSAFPGGGKTSFMDQVAAHASQRWHTDLFTMEMNNNEQTTRLISQLSGIPSGRLRSGKLLEHEWALLTAAIEKLASLKLRIEDGPQTMDTIRAKTMRHRAMGQLDLVVIDYAGLITSPGASMFERYSLLSRDLKIMADDLQVPVFAAHQLNREAHQQGKPTMFNLRGSGSWEQDADIIFLLYETEGAASNDLTMQPRTLEVAKHRMGATGEIALNFCPPSTTFYLATVKTEKLYGPRH